MIDITPERLYKIGIWCFIIAGLANLADIIFYPEKYTLFRGIASIFTGVLFNFALAFLFNFLLKNSPTMETVQSSDDIDEIIKEVQSGNSNAGTIKRVPRKKVHSRSKR